jgi:hypothetical protein
MLVGLHFTAFSSPALYLAAQTPSYLQFPTSQLHRSVRTLRSWQRTSATPCKSPTPSPLRQLLTRFSAERNQKESPFFRLPSKLRNKIYRYYLNTATIDVKTYYVGDIGLSNWSEHTAFTRQENNLPLVCRQVHQESQPFHNNYHSLKVIIVKGFSWFMREVKYLFTRRDLGAVREVEIMENTALDLVRCYEQHLATGGD